MPCEKITHMFIVYQKMFKIKLKLSVVQWQNVGSVCARLCFPALQNEGNDNKKVREEFMANGVRQHKREF